MGAQRTDQCIDVSGRQDLRQCPGHPHQRRRLDPTTTPTSGESLRHRIRLDRRVASGHQIRVEARHRRQSTGDGAGRQPRLAVGDPHHGAIASLVGQELEYVGRHDVDRVLVDDREERFQIVGHGPQGVRSDPSRHELEIGLDERFAQSETGLSGRRGRADQDGEGAHPGMLSALNRMH